MIDYIWVIDTGHAWLRVPLSDDNLEGISISNYSHVDSRYVYLDRNLDAGNFLQAYVNKHRSRPKIVKRIVSYPAYVRKLRRCAQQLELL